MGPLRVGQPFGLPVFPDHQYHLASLRPVKRRIGGNRDYWQRGFGRHFLVYGRREHDVPGGGAKRRQRLSAQSEYSKTGIRAWRTVRTLGAAVHTCADYADGSDRSV